MESRPPRSSRGPPLRISGTGFSLSFFLHQLPSAAQRSGPPIAQAERIRSSRHNDLIGTRRWSERSNSASVLCRNEREVDRHSRRAVAERTCGMTRQRSGQGPSKISYGCQSSLGSSLLSEWGPNLRSKCIVQGEERGFHVAGPSPFGLRTPWALSQQPSPRSCIQNFRSQNLFRHYFRARVEHTAAPCTFRRLLD
jgi:hypothetical protein